MNILFFFKFEHLDFLTQNKYIQTLRKKLIF